MTESATAEYELLSTQNDSGSSNDSMLSFGEIYASVIYRILICVIGIIGNVIVVIAIVAARRKSATQWYLIQLAIADTMFLITIPFRITELVYNKWIFSDGMCKAREAVTFVNYYSSIIFLMVMSIDRYIAICRVFSARGRKLRRKKSVCAIILIVWIVSLLMSIPVMVYSIKEDQRCRLNFGHTEMSEKLINSQDPQYQETTHLEFSTFAPTAPTSDSEEEPPHPACSYARTPSGWKIFVSFNFIVMFLVPFTIMAVCYCLIAIRLRKKTQTGRIGDSGEKNRIRAAIICFILVILFLVSWLPFHVVHLSIFIGIQASMKFCFELIAVTSGMTYANSALNPYVYNFLGTKFREHLRCCCVKNNGQEYSGTETDRRPSNRQNTTETLILHRMSQVS